MSFQALVGNRLEEAVDKSTKTILHLLNRYNAPLALVRKVEREIRWPPPGTVLLVLSSSFRHCPVLSPSSARSSAR